MKKLLLLILPVVLVLASCQKDGSGISGDGEKDVEMKLSSLTRAMGDETLDEKSIKELDLLVFDGDDDNATFLARRHAWKKGGSTNTYRATVKAGNGLTIYFVANARQLLDDLTPSVLDEGNATWGDIKEGLVMGTPQNITAAGGLPMWGLLHNINITEQPQQHLGTIKLVRSVASADIYLTLGDPNEFDLETGYLVFGANKGFLAFSESKLVTAGGKYEMSGPESPSGMLANQTLTHNVSTGGKEIANVFYMYENDAAIPPAAGGNRQSRIILKGTWNGAGGKGVPTYYPLDFRDADTDNRMQVTRNNKYLLVITKVNGDGFDDIEDAKNGYAENVDYNVIPWTNVDDDDIHIYGDKYISIQRKTAYLTRPANSVDSIRFSTNFDLSDIKMKFDPADAGVGNSIENDRFRIEILTNNGTSYFKFTAKEKYGFNADNEQDLTVVVGGKIQFVIRIIQSAEDPRDWSDGGNQNEDLDKP